MSTVSRVTTWADNQVLTATALNAEFDNILSDYNGGITNANISGSAGITYGKLSLTGSIVNADLAGSIDKAKITNTAVTLSDSQTLTNKTLTAPTINNPLVKGAYEAWVTDSDGATVTFDLSAGNKHRVTLGGNRTLALSNVQNGQAFVIKLTQDGTGSRTVTWFSTISWAGGSAPTLTTTLNKSDVFGFIQTGSNTYDGFIVGQNL